jgi:hypothetical protein
MALLLEGALGISFEPRIRRKIQTLLDEVEDCHFPSGADDPEILVHSRRLPDVAYIVHFESDTGLYLCGCHMTIRHGYPCVHLLTVLLEK